MKVIFLDFDGPIIPDQSHRIAPEKANMAWPACVDALNRITNTIGAKLVISSSWRYMGEANVRILLKGWGVTGEVIGITTTKLESRWQANNPDWKPIPRGLEIQDWLSKNPLCEDFVILDDVDNMLHLSNRLILIPFTVGLTETDADVAIMMLQG